MVDFVHQQFEVFVDGFPIVLCLFQPVFRHTLVVRSKSMLVEQFGDGDTCNIPVNDVSMRSRRKLNFHSS